MPGAGRSATFLASWEPKDIELVMSQATRYSFHFISQATCTRSKAISALKSNDGDIVNAIMELTM
jgi:NACalpha-BTF3-like transcription factor